MIDPCDICGGIGFVQNIVTCFQCKSSREHCYCMRKILLTVPEFWLCEECCRLSKAVVSDSIMAEDVPLSSTSINYESFCTSSVLKPSRKPVDLENEMVSESNTSKTLSPTRFHELGSACKQGDASVGNVKKSSVPSESEHLARNTVSSLDQPSAMATASNSSPTGSKVASTKASLKKFKPTHDNRKIRHCRSKFIITTLQKSKQTSNFLKDEETSATCEKEKHDSFVLGECDKVSPEGLDSLPVNTIASTLTKSDLENIVFEYHIDTNRYHLCLPQSSERANSHFSCKNTFCIYAGAFKAGLRLPLHPLIPEILSEFRVAPTQIPPNSWRVLICFISFCNFKIITPTVNLFRAIYHLKYRKGWWYFSARSGLKLFEGFPQSFKRWRHRFFKIRTSERDALGVHTKWCPPKSEANQSPTLSAIEMKAMDDLVALAIKNPPDVGVLLSEEALIQAGISSPLLKLKGSESEMKRHHSLSQSGLVRALQRKRAASESGKSASCGLRCQEPILIDVDQEDLPERKRPKESLQPMKQIDLLQQTELTNRPQEIAPNEFLNQQASPESNVQHITGASAPRGSSIHFNTATEDVPRSNTEVMRTGSVEYTREQSVFTHPALAKQLVSQMVLPHDWDSVAQRDTFVVAQELRCQAMEDATWKMGVSEKLIKMQHEINLLKEERNALRESQKMEVTELDSARKTSVELQKEVERLENRLKGTEENYTKLKRRMIQAENHAASAKRKVVVAEKKCRQSEMEKSRVAEETLKNYKASQEFQHEVEEYHAEAYGMGLNIAIEKIKRQFPGLDLSMIDFYSED